MTSNMTLLDEKILEYMKRNSILYAYKAKMSY